MMLGAVLLSAGAAIVAAGTVLSRVLARPNTALGARPPTGASFVLVGVGFIIVGIASVMGWI
jgi:hypothetical protein